MNSNICLNRVGIILAGGNNQRLRPSSLVVSKSLLPVYDKPLIYYSLSLLLLAKIREILIISTERDIPNFQKLFGDGMDLGLDISYKVQPSPDGLPQAYILGKEFIKDRSSCLVLGDNILYGDGLSNILQNFSNYGCSILGYKVSNPNAYGVLKFNQGVVCDIIEKTKRVCFKLCCARYLFL